MMQMKYSFEPDSNILHKVSFTGLSGGEGCRTVKEALNKLQIENPAKTFANNMKRGTYNTVPQSLVEREAFVINDISEIWKFEGDDELQAEMNCLSLLANALTHIVKLQQELERLRGE